MQPMIAMRDLTKLYGRSPALADVNLEVPPGVVFGYLGPNGAGKTTTIRILVGLMRPSRGSVSVAGIDIVRERSAAQRHIGYLPGQFVAYPDLTGEQYLSYLAALRGGVEPAVLRRLVERMDLDVGVRIGAMSHGNRQKVGIVQAFMTEPDLLVLDEPTQGLDPLVQREFLAMLRETRDAGRTVFLSSHVLSEVQAVADTVAILRRGRLVEVRSVAELTARSMRRLDLTFAATPPDVGLLRAVGGVRSAERDDHVLHVEVDGSTAELLKFVAPYGVADIVSDEPDLEDVFLTYYGQDR
ncbi:ABC transporter ATP-binding protein [Nocardia seriolae]|uniref:Spermidine/putrescine import ATP-binding protein PotA n=2 Tax=Nocardia seriolae TaxID=37332 RepID=A0ABC8AXM7_9NOCA|nr:ABC transporter ATP-binding protein [Nocardia seriolae]GEM23669.1 ABC transporter [Nocardia seriolae NBRC 15557]APA98953.1 Spermidine/putrescine import ATP-binding protein PotA [Nocardia seriolae]OJF80409.1 ABC transporter [Nocardia seriolae]QOW35643.1 ABC transporter ATP-binding protein [Nocardia seriolae]WKY55504.1 ABC transporter ATP-binding protein [Nocardia seriolae]